VGAIPTCIINKETVLELVRTERKQRKKKIKMAILEEGVACRKATV
jgi:hypothetical protein